MHVVLLILTNTEVILFFVMNILISCSKWMAVDHLEISQIPCIVVSDIHMINMITKLCKMVCSYDLVITISF